MDPFSPTTIKACRRHGSAIICKALPVILAILLTLGLTSNQACATLHHDLRGWLAQSERTADDGMRWRYGSSRMPYCCADCARPLVLLPESLVSAPSDDLADKPERCAFCAVDPARQTIFSMLPGSAYLSLAAFRTTLMPSFILNCALLC